MNSVKFKNKIPERQKKWVHLLAVICITFVTLWAVYGIIYIVWPEGLTFLAKEPNEINKNLSGQNTSDPAPKVINTPDWVAKNYLTPNEYSRPQTPLLQVNGIVVHYVGNPGTTAEGNRNYFEQLATTQDTYASSHFIIGLDGEIIQCIPLNEIAYCSNNRNSDTISIECCHPDADGKFNAQTYDALIQLVDWLCQTYGLNPQTDVIRHYDVTGKECPKYYVDHPDAWEQFIQELKVLPESN